MYLPRIVFCRGCLSIITMQIAFRKRIILISDCFFY